MTVPKEKRDYKKEVARRNEVYKTKIVKVDRYKCEILEKLLEKENDTFAEMVNDAIDKYIRNHK